jgi:glutamate/tyrosine decarboxylase-like PLP-dependent enzyme
MHEAKTWQQALGGDLPRAGVGIDQTLSLMNQYLIPNGSAIPKPGCTSFITTGATSIGSLATLAGSVAAPQRLGLTAFSYLEELSLEWLARLFELPKGMRGVYSSGGSTANLLALGAARQSTFEALGVDPSENGVTQSCAVYTSKAAHRTIQRACAVLGLGRSAVKLIQTHRNGRINIDALRERVNQDAEQGVLALAIVANAGATDTGVIDPLLEMGKIAKQMKCWFHVDGAYGLPGILDPKHKPQFEGLELADSVIVDPHKWLGAPVGIGATFVADRELLKRAFAQGEAPYLEGSFIPPKKDQWKLSNSMDGLGEPYSDYGIELSAPSRGAVVWALLKEIGVDGLRARVCRHNSMAQYVADRASNEPELELMIEPRLSICCFRYIDPQVKDLDFLNSQIHRRLVHRGVNIPSTTVIEGELAIRPCFVGARTRWQHAEDLVEEVLLHGRELVSEIIQNQGRIKPVRNA